MGWAKGCDRCVVTLYNGQGRRLLSWRAESGVEGALNTDGVLATAGLGAGSYWAILRIPGVGVRATSLTVK